MSKHKVRIDYTWCGNPPEEYTSAIAVATFVKRLVRETVPDAQLINLRSTRHGESPSLLPYRHEVEMVLEFHVEVSSDLPHQVYSEVYQLLCQIPSYDAGDNFGNTVYMIDGRDVRVEPMTAEDAFGGATQDTREERK